MPTVTVTRKSRARVRTSMGDFVMEFLPDKAPRTVENFVTLAHKGFYDGLTFHRVLQGFIAQGGDPRGDGTGGPGYTIRPEFNDTPHVRGTVSMARSSDPHSAGSQFFVVLGDARYLDHRYAAFARVVEGLEVLDKIGSVPVDEDPRFRELSRPRDPIFINGIDLENVEIVEDERGGKAPAPEGEAAQAGDGDGGEEVPARKGGRSRRGGRGKRKERGDDEDQA